MLCGILVWVSCHSVPFAEDDVVIGIAQAGDGHVGQLKLLQLSHDCGAVGEDKEMRDTHRRKRMNSLKDILMIKKKKKKEEKSIWPNDRFIRWQAEHIERESADKTGV